MTDSSSLKGQKYVRYRSSINGREGLQNGRGEASFTPTTWDGGAEKV